MAKISSAMDVTINLLLYFSSYCKDYLSVGSIRVTFSSNNGASLAMYVPR